MFFSVGRGTIATISSESTLECVSHLISQETSLDEVQRTALTPNSRRGRLGSLGTLLQSQLSRFSERSSSLTRLRLHCFVCLFVFKCERKQFEGCRHPDIMRRNISHRVSQALVCLRRFVVVVIFVRSGSVGKASEWKY